MKQLYEYQKRYIARMPKNCIMGADVGLGKTIMSLEHYRKHGEGRPLLVLAPASKVKTGDWQDEITDYFGLAQPEWWVESYDKFARRPLNYMGVKDLVIIADECHFICNSQSKRSKAVQKVMKTNASQFIGLSATPLPNGWTSMENYAILFGLSKNKTEFQRRFVKIDRTRGFPIVTGYNEENVLERFWNNISKHLDRNGNIELPEVMNLPVKIEPPDDFKAMYAKMRLTRTAPDGELLDNPSKFFNALRQSLTPLRRDDLQAIIESTREHIVVFYNYDAERELILDVISKLDKSDKRVVYEQSGHASKLPRRATWDKMKPSVTLAQYQSASQAIELTYASVTIFLSPTYSYSNFHQAKGRTHRPGQKKRTLFYMFSVQGSLDQQVWLALRQKQNFNTRIWASEELEEGDMN